MARLAFILASLLGPQMLCTGFTTCNNNNPLLRSPALCNSLDENNCDNNVVQRRNVLNNLLGGVAAFTMATALSTPAQALDFDAFESSVISKDSETLIPKLNDDEALCKYGAPGKAMGEACERAKMKPNLPGVVDATGKVDRGDYLKCKYEYPIINGEYVKTRVCKPSKEWAP